MINNNSDLNKIMMDKHKMEVLIIIIKPYFLRNAHVSNDYTLIS